MNGLFDTNILIDYLNGIQAAKTEIERFSRKYISIITYIEILIGVNNDNIPSTIKNFLSMFEVIDVDRKIADISIVIRKKYRLKILDAIILATAESLGVVLVTRNTKDFSSDIPIVRIPYQI